MTEAERIIGTPEPVAGGTAGGPEGESTDPGPAPETGRKTAPEKGPAPAKDTLREAGTEAEPEAEAALREPAGEPADEASPAGTAASPAAAASTASAGKRRIAVLAAVAAFAYALDLITKIIVVAELEPRHAPIEVIGDVLRFQAVRNGGAAFGIGEALTIVFTLIAAVVIVVIVRIARKLRSTPWAVALGMLLGGAFGNLTDRIFRSPGLFEGHVVDFIAPAHFAVFNLADSAIVCGGILIVILSFRGVDPDGTVHRG